MKDEALLKRLRQAFKEEAGERLASMSSSLVELEKIADPEKQDPVLEVVFREAHSLKGAARAVNLKEIEILFQCIEGIFAAVRKKESAFSVELFDLLHESVHAVENFLASFEEEKAPPSKEALKLFIAKLERAKTGKAQKPVKAPLTAESVIKKSQTTETLRISTSTLDDLLLKAEEFISIKLMFTQHLSELRRIESTCDCWGKQWAKIEPILRFLGKEAREEEGYSGLLEFLQWNQDYFKNLTHEIKTLVKGAGQDQYTLSRKVDDLLDDMKKVMMLPFSSLFGTFPSMVRDISREQGKAVDLVMTGAEIDVDRRILDEMKDPLIHLLRNAIDHGLEEPEVRSKRKKPLKGTITLSVSRIEGKKIEILLSDDGGGIDIDSVRRKAVKAGILSEKEARDLSEKEALSLIFRSQISTSPIITQISGRGIGLAIVQEAVERIGGLLFVDTEVGKGTVFRMQLPITLATFRGILVKASGNSFILPSTHVERILRINRDEIKSVENMATIPLDGRVLSFVSLSQVLGLPDKSLKEENSTLINVAVLGSGDKRIAFKVDEVVMEQEVLVKGFGKQLNRVKNISGATILGNGKVVPILNIQDLLKTSGSGISAFSEVVDSEANMDQRGICILVVEDSITSRTLIKNILEASGYQVETAVDGQDGYTRLKTGKFDLVVSDVEMPGMNGFDLTARIRADNKLAEMPVVLVTARESREDRERGIDAGADAYIVKSSFDQSNLVEVVGRLI